MKKLIGSLAGPALLAITAGWMPAAAAQESPCNTIAIGPEEYVIVTGEGEVILLPREGEIGVRIDSAGKAAQFRFRPGESPQPVRADVETVGGETLRGFVCVGCLLDPGEFVPARELANFLELHKGEVVYRVPLLSLLSIEASGAGEWKLAFRMGETVTGGLALPPEANGLSLQTDFGFVNLPLKQIASVTILQ